MFFVAAKLKKPLAEQTYVKNNLFFDKDFVSIHLIYKQNSHTKKKVRNGRIS